MTTVHDLEIDADQITRQRARLEALADELAATGRLADTDALRAFIVIADQLIDAAGKNAQSIKRVYCNGDAAGEELVSFEEFATDCIQDQPVALEAVRTMIALGEYFYGDEDERIQETYTIADPELLYQQLDEIHPEDRELAGLDIELLR